MISVVANTQHKPLCIYFNRVAKQPWRPDYVVARVRLVVVHASMCLSYERICWFVRVLVRSSVCVCVGFCESFTKISFGFEIL